MAPGEGGGLQSSSMHQGCGCACHQTEPKGLLLREEPVVLEAPGSFVLTRSLGSAALPKGSRIFFLFLIKSNPQVLAGGWVSNLVGFVSLVVLGVATGWVRWPGRG